MSWVLAALVTGAAVFCVLVVVAARSYLAQTPGVRGQTDPVSILKPLAGIDEGLEENLRSFFRQDYGGAFEVLFAVREAADPAVAVAERVRAGYPGVPSRVLIVGEPPWPNAKVWSLHHLTQAAAYDLLVMSDSDIRVTPDFLATVAAEFSDPALGVTTCPYRAVPGASLWSKLEAMMMNTEFLAGILAARLIEGMRFSVGPTIVARKAAIAKTGGWPALSDFLAEDFVLGQRAAEAGMGVGLSRYVIEHRIGSAAFVPNARHRLRWCRSTRRSRPVGYAGQVFTNPVPLAVLLLAAAPGWWPLCAAALVLRGWAAYGTAGRILRDPLCRANWWLIPAADFASFLFWLGGFFGNTIAWRGRTFFLHKDGRFERIA